VVLTLILVGGLLGCYSETFRQSQPSLSECPCRDEKLLRRKILAAVTREERLDVYRPFRRELTGYRLRLIACTPDVDWRRVLADVKAGESLELLTLLYARPGESRRPSRLWRPEQLWGFFGPEATESVASLKVGQVAP